MLIYSLLALNSQIQDMGLNKNSTPHLDLLSLEWYPQPAESKKVKACYFSEGFIKEL